MKDRKKKIKNKGNKKRTKKRKKKGKEVVAIVERWITRYASSNANCSIAT